MFRYCLFFLIFSFISCHQADSREFKLRNSFSVNWRDEICISTNDCFYFDYDIDRVSQKVFYSHGENTDKQLIDSVGFSAYSLILYDFKSRKNKAHIVVLKTEYEHLPSFSAYYIKGNTLKKLGEWWAYTLCESCDSQDYPIEGIRIFQKDERIEFTFSQDVYYLKGDENDWDFYEAGTLRLSFMIDD